MAIEYTPQQSRAITTQEKSILVSAAAGSGKTAVLVQRIIEMICKDNGPDIDQLLVVTFTNPAAAEMKDKIYREVMNRIAKEPKNKKLRRQILLLSNANIQTIHSFCLNVIKNNINMLPIPVQFRVADETECSVLKLKCVNELIEDKFESGDEAFLMFSDTYGYGRDDQKMIDLILKCYEFSSALANPEQYYEFCIGQAQAVTEDFTSTVFAEILIERLQEILQDYEQKYRIALEEIEAIPELLPYRDLFSEEYRWIQTMLSENDFLRLQEAVLRFEFLALNRVKGVKRGTDNEFIKGIRNQFKNDLSKFVPLVANSTEHEKNDNRFVLEFIKILTGLTKEFTTRYAEEKRKKSLLDFSDFEHFALQLLSDEAGQPNEIAKSYQQKFHEILIDEYQDTNDIQDHLFRLISRNGENLFLVGDVKQSIYGFRQAKPQIFIEKQENYQDEKHELILLSNNFRSRKQVVDAVNCIFSQTMTPKTGKTDYQKEALVQSAPYSEASSTDYGAEILLFDRAEKYEPTEENPEEYNNEAIMIAKRIHELVDIEKMQVYDLKTQTFHDACYGDIVILLRSMTDFSEKLYHTLLEYGIPVTAEFSENLFASLEIRVMLAILKAIDNPYDDLSLLALLKSPIFHWTEEMIFNERNLAPKAPFICALKQSKNEAAKKIVAFLREFQTVAYTENISRLMEQLYSDFHLKELFCVYKNPEQRLENLEIFYQMAKHFDKTQISGLKGFLAFLEESIHSKKNVPAFREQPPENSVKIISMHKSKGLEYPIVFAAGLGKRFNNDDAKSQVIFHADLGIGADYIDAHQRYSYPTLTKKAFGVMVKNESVSEEMRILYVALTRAKEKLILTATIPNLEKSMQKWQQIQQTGGITKNLLYQSTSFIDYIMPCVSGRKEYRISDFTISDLLTVESKTVTEDALPANQLKTPVHLFHRYQNAELTLLPSKVAVTAANRLTKEPTPVKNIVLSDLEILEQRYSQSEYGTYFHKVFECLNLEELKKGLTPESAVKQAIQLAGIREYSDDVSEKMLQFLDTNIAKKLLQADLVYREKAFLVRIPANRIYPVDTEEAILLQGTTDCYFICGEEITLLDFKTDRNPNPEKIRNNYGKQIELYSYALEKIEGKKVTEKLIYTTTNHQLISF